MFQDILKNAQPQMEKIVQNLTDEFRTLHTGKATAGLVEDILVDYYGTKTPLKQMAQIAVPQPNQIVIIPWDKAALGDITNSIQNSELSLNPIKEANQVRLVLPPLSEERRRELTKAVKTKAETAKVAVRNMRRGAWDEITKLEKSGKITEDDKYDGQEELNKIIKEIDDKIDQAMSKKESEIMKV